MTAPTTPQAQVSEERPQHWAVSVRADGDEIVCIESNCLSGRDISEEDEKTIRNAAHHLLAFIGDPDPSALSTPPARDDVAALVEALKPFAYAAGELDEKTRDTSDIWESSVAMTITAGDLRRAAQSLARVRDGGK